MGDSGFWTTFFMWFINIAYLGALVPQIILNYKMKSTAGLSDLYLLGYLSGYAMQFFYSYGLDFPMAYKVMGVITFLAVCLIISQRIFYKDLLINFASLKLYILVFGIIVLSGCFLFNYPKNLGILAGWVATVVWAVYQLPQVYKIYKAKSVVGFSFVLATLIGLGNLMDFGLAIILRWPIQSYLIALRGLIIYAIFCFQFWIYSDIFQGEFFQKIGLRAKKITTSND